MLRFRQPLLITLSFLFIAFPSVPRAVASVFPSPSMLARSLQLAVPTSPPEARQSVGQQSVQTQQQSEDEKDKRARKAERKKETSPEKESAQPTTRSAGKEETVEIIADRQSKTGDLIVYEGYVNATQDQDRLQADRLTLNTTTNDAVAEGNVIFDQGADQRVTARRAEINWNTKKGVFWDTTGFTNRTQTGDYVFFTAARVEKTGPDTYELYDAEVTACEDAVPKWGFKVRHAELKMGDRVIMHNAVFHIKTLPAFVLPYAWIPATRRERKSGFLLPSTGTSNQKGRTLKLAYYQTLGESADITFRGDIYTQRGIGLGAEFRAQTDERSYLRLGGFTVKDRLFGPPGENQGGTAFIVEGIQHLPHGWLAVGNVSLVSSLAFRQIFSDDISQVIDPRRESTFYANNNSNGFSFNFLASNETTTLFAPSRNPLTPSAGTNFDIKVRQAPEIDITVYPRRIFGNTPVYLSFESSAGALKKEETVDPNLVFATPASVQRFDFQPKITVPLATVAGVAVTPSLTVRETVYTSSLDPSVPPFDPDKFTLDPADPRLNPSRVEFRPDLKLFDRNLFNPITEKNVSRHYAELAVDVRPPALEKTYTNDDGSTRFKHLIEPYITYRMIGGIGNEFNRIIRFDDADAVADTNEVEYAVVNRFFTKQLASDVTRKRPRIRRAPSGMKPVRPSEKDKPDRDKQPTNQNKPEPSATSEPPALEQKHQSKSEPAQTAESKQKLETGQQQELNPKDKFNQQKQATTARADSREPSAETVSSVDAAPQAYELLTIKVAQKYFFDRNFGGALIEGRRNQFYPINALSGFTFGGRERAFSPLNIAVRYRPLSSVYADLRMDLSNDGGVVRNITVDGGMRTDRVTVSASYYLSRQIKLPTTGFEPGTFPGDQVTATLQLGNDLRGFYGGSRMIYDFTDRFITDTQISRGRLMNSRSYIGYAWDCCGVQFNYSTFKAGLRNESAWSFTFTLAGLGSYGTDQFSQLGGGRGARKRGKRLRGDDDYY